MYDKERTRDERVEWKFAKIEIIEKNIHYQAGLGREPNRRGQV